MLETAFVQLRFATSIVFGVPFFARSLDRIVDGLIATQREFGAIGSVGLSCWTARRSTRRPAAFGPRPCAARETPYARLFDTLGLDPARLRYEHIQRIPLTPSRRCATTPMPLCAGRASPAEPTKFPATTGIIPVTLGYCSWYDLSISYR